MSQDLLTYIDNSTDALRYVGHRSLDPTETEKTKFLNVLICTICFIMIK